MSGPVAAVDCGTNSTRLLITDAADGAAADRSYMDRRQTVTRLGRGVDASGRLHPEAVEETLDCLRAYRSVLDRHKVQRVRAAATSAVRDAANRAEFLDAAGEAIGAPVELLTPAAEATLSFRGATAGLAPAVGGWLVLDIGGGSTELALGPGPDDPLHSADPVSGPRPGLSQHSADPVSGPRLGPSQHSADPVSGPRPGPSQHSTEPAPESGPGLQWHSAEVGCVRLTERYVHHDPPRPEELAACLQVTELHLDDAARAMPGITAGCELVATGGTATTAAAVELGLPAYDSDRIHRFELTRAAAEDVFRTLATESAADRIANPGLHPDRAGVIVAGLCILVKVMRYFDFDRCLVSEADILDGLARSLLSPAPADC